MPAVNRAFSALAHHWDLDPGVVFLNHGSFGACPREVQQAQTALRQRLESEPVRFLLREAPPLLAKSREVLGRLLGCDADDLVQLTNAT